MALRLYMDQHVPRAITAQLRMRGVDVMPAFEDGSSTLDGPALLDRATELERVLFTREMISLPKQRSGSKAGNASTGSSTRISFG